MFESIKVIVHQVTEALAEGGMRNVLRQRVFWNRLATPVVMELSASNFPLTDYLQNTNFQFVEISRKDLQAGKWFFEIHSRESKALRNLKRGWCGFAIIKDSTVVGDVWCVKPGKDKKRIFHSDLNMLGIICEDADAYAFDMLIATEYRGKNLAVPLQKSLQATLKKEGCQRVYGFYWDDNLPALWMHRMLKFKELPKRRISRFFFLVKSKIAGSTKLAQNGLTQQPNGNNRNPSTGISETNVANNAKQDGIQSETRIKTQKEGDGDL